MNNTIKIKRFIANFYSALKLSSRSKPRVLLYHSIGCDGDRVQQDSFFKQLDWITRNGNLKGLDQVLTEGARDQSNCTAITFDDGYASLYDHALPILKPFDVGATVYLNTAYISENSRQKSDPSLGLYPKEEFLIWREVEGLLRAGWTLGSHGANHVDLTKLKKERLVEELTSSKFKIYHKLGVECTHFAYTWGRCNRLVKQSVANAGYHFAAGGVHGSIGRSYDRLAFPRINVDAHWSLDDFQAVMRGDWDYLKWLQRGRQSYRNLFNQITRVEKFESNN